MTYCYKPYMHNGQAISRLPVSRMTVAWPAAYCFCNSASIALSISSDSGWTPERNRATISPLRLIRNFSKFHWASSIKG